MEGCRGVVVMGRPRDPKTFHKNRKLNLLFILIFERQVCQKREKAVPRSSQLSAYSKETHPQRPVVSTGNSAIYGAIKHVPHTSLFSYV